jgi:hypothetical protein
MTSEQRPPVNNGPKGGRCGLTVHLFTKHFALFFYQRVGEFDSRRSKKCNRLTFFLLFTPLFSRPFEVEDDAALISRGLTKRFI